MRLRGRHPPPQLRLASLPDAEFRSLVVPGRQATINPSIASGGRGFFCTVNSNDEENDGAIAPLDGRSSEVWIAELDSDLSVLDIQRINLPPREESNLGRMSDGRPFQWKGAWWLLASWSFYSSPDRCQLTLCRLEGTAIVEQQLLPSPMQAALEKNWMPLIRGERLELIYWIDPMEVMTYRGENDLSHRRIARWGRLDDWRGSSQCVRYGESWLCVVHLRTHVLRSIYTHRFVEFSDDFRIRRVSQPFVFEIDGIEFCAGLCLTETHAVLSYGVRDCEARLVRLNLSRVESMLQPFRPPGALARAWLSVRVSIRPLTHSPWIRQPRKQLRAMLARWRNPESG